MYQVVASADPVPGVDPGQHPEPASRPRRVCRQVLRLSRPLLDQPRPRLPLPGRGKWGEQKITVPEHAHKTVEPTF